MKKVFIYIFMILTLIFTVNSAINDSLQFMYHFSGNVSDSSGNNRILNNNGATLTTDKNNRTDLAYEFHASESDSMNTTTGDLTGSVGSVAVWFKSNYSTNIDQYIYANTDTTAGKYYVMIRRYLSGYYIGLNDDFILETTAPRDTNWHFIVVTWNSSTTWKYYFDGGLNGTGASAKNPTNIFTQRIGAEANKNGTSGSFYWDGKIDEVRKYSRPLTASEVTELYNAYDYYFAPVTNSCTVPSINTNWVINSNDNCTIANQTINMGTGNLTYIGNGTITFNNVTLTTKKLERNLSDTGINTVIWFFSSIINLI